MGVNNDNNTHLRKGAITHEEGAAQFEDIFRGHNDYSDDFVEAAKSDNQELRMEAEAEVDEFVEEFSTFLDAATEGNLPKEAAADALELHEDQVLSVFDNYVKGDYEEAWMSFREGYAFMFGVGETLGNAIVTQMPDKLEETMMPEEMPETVELETPTAVELRGNLLTWDAVRQESLIGYHIYEVVDGKATHIESVPSHARKSIEVASETGVYYYVTADQLGNESKPPEMTK